ncbi:hypothetical protein GF406_17280 [candidate division KSB1 bacterium]|nr:hypothetical protein [candidate division KSB1 bacterium]
MQSLQELSQKRQQFLNALKENRFRFKDLLVGNYENPAHFIYELIQNADDAGASNIHFKLLNHRLECIHDGRPFDINDVEAITSIGVTTKDKNLNQIGKFGVGFKSVYAISRSPQIHSGSFHFNIRDFVLPVELDSPELAESGTIFSFPFDHEFRSKEDIYELIDQQLHNLTPHVMLFLNHITTLTWQTKTQGSEWQIESHSPDPTLTIKSIHDSQKSYRFLMLENSLRLPDETDVGYSLAFRLKQDKLCADPDAKWCVFLPTEKHNPLPFSLHGDYRTTPNREQIPLHESINEKIVKASADLLDNKLGELTHKGHYDPLHLDVLPVDKSKADQDAVYRLFYKALIKALKENALLPDENQNLHLPKDLIAGQDRELIELFDANRLSHLNKQGWLHPLLCSSSRIRSALPDMGLEWQNPETLLTQIDLSFIQEQPDGWLIKLYRYLFKRPELWHKSSRSAMPLFRYLPILRLEDGRHVHLNQAENEIKCYLPPPKRATSLPIIKRSICRDSKSRHFLQRLGLNEPDTMAELNLLLRNYGEPKRIQWQKYEKDIQQLLDLYTGLGSQQQTVLAKRISEFALVAAHHPKEGTLLQYPDKIYWPTETLKSYFQDMDRWFVKQRLLERFSQDKLLPFLHNLGLRRLPRRISVKSDLSDSEKRDLREGKWVIDRELYIHDYQLDGLNSFLESVTSSKSVLLWNMLLEMINLYEKEFMGEYAWLDIHKKSAAFPAAFVRQLRRTPWLMDQESQFHTPLEIDLDHLSPQYKQPEPEWNLLADLLEMATPTNLSAQERRKLALIKDLSLQELRALLSLHKKKGPQE